MRSGVASCCGVSSTARSGFVLLVGYRSLAVEQFIAEPGGEDLDEAVLPRRPGLDASGLGADRADPVLDSLRYELRVVIGPDLGRNDLH